MAGGGGGGVGGGQFIFLIVFKEPIKLYFGPFLSGRFSRQIVMAQGELLCGRKRKNLFVIFRLVFSQPICLLFGQLSFVQLSLDRLSRHQVNYFVKVIEFFVIFN